MTRPSTTAARRPGFTLVELLVAMAVIVALAAIALIVVPDVLTQDRTTDGAGTVRQTLMIAKARALRDKGPRGVRFLVGSDPSNLAKYNAGATGQLWVTEMQYIEKPPPLVPAENEYLEIVFTTAADGTIQTTAPNDPKVYYHPPTAPAAADPDPGTPIREFINAEIDQGRKTDIHASFGDERMTLTVSNAAAAKLDAATRQGAPRANAYLVRLDTTDAAATAAMYAGMMRALGGGTSVKLTTFRVERPAQPLLGEPSVPLPRNVCVDLNFGVSKTSAGVVTKDLDILFAPSGEVMFASVDQIYLWVRDYTKVADMAPVTPTAATPNQPYTYAGLGQFERGGEQQVVSLKAKSGAMGVFPVQWPQADGTYPLIAAPSLYDDPFGFARRAAQ